MPEIKHTERFNALLCHALLGSAGAPEWRHPKEFQNSDDFFKHYACYNYLRKYEGQKDQVNLLHKKTVESFRGRESVVRELNRKLRYLDENNPVPVYEGIPILELRRRISLILGPFDVDEFFMSCGWGPGSTSSLKGKDARLDRKITEGRWTLTTRCYPYARTFLQEAYAYHRARGLETSGPTTLLPGKEFCFVESSRFSTVPKTTTERRPIDIQPTLNLFFQKGLGKMIRRRLLRHGIDLNDQSRNQNAAAVAQVQELSTIDLEAASDSLSKELVRLIIPSDWFVHLENLRTTRTKIDSVDYPLEKFSSMGNGFTFELESLIFYAIAKAICKKDRVLIYGDDIIVKSRHAPEVIELLSACGFTTNMKKTFISGRFFESCGKHYFDGHDVTPIYQKKPIVNTFEAFAAANRILRLAYRFGHGDFDERFRTVWDAAFSVAIRFWKAEAPKHLRRQVPILGTWYKGDNALCSPDGVCCPPHVGYVLTSLVYKKSTRKRAAQKAVLAESLRSPEGEHIGYKTSGFLDKRGLLAIRDSKDVLQFKKKQKVWLLSNS
nr:MAG: RNA replicase beta chain [Sanya fiers-like virus 29]